MSEPGVTLVVWAHPEPSSFNAAWARASVEGARAAGQEVLTSDLCAMGFDPVEGPGHYRRNGPFDPLKAQEQAAQAGEMPADVAAEVAKVEAADRIVLHFPIWWFGPPAILKGWLDRALVHGRLHDVDRRFDTGLCRSKRVLLCVTTGAGAAETGHDGKEGDLMLQLWPVAHTFRYLGAEVLLPLTQHGVHGYLEGDERAAKERALTETLERQAAVMADFDALPRWPFNPESDFDANGRLRAQAPSLSPMIRHEA